MADNGSNAEAQVAAAASVEQSSGNAEVAPTVQQESKPVEKTFTRDQVAVISNKVKNETYDKARKEFEAKQPQAVSQAPAQDVQLENAVSSQTYDIQQLVDEKVNAKLQDEQRKYTEAQNQAEATKVYNTFSQKMQEGKDKYEDFDQIVNDLFIPDANGMVSPKVANIVAEATNLDNTVEVMYELAKNPKQLAAIGQLQDISLPKAKLALKELSDSIKTNQVAINAKRPNAPLSQIKPSPTGADNGNMTAADLRSHPELRG